MTELLSVLVLTYLVRGDLIESEMQLPHNACMQAQQVIASGVGSGVGPVVETWDGSKAPVLTATCVAACQVDSMAREWALLPLRESDEETEG